MTDAKVPVGIRSPHAVVRRIGVGGHTCRCGTKLSAGDVEYIYPDPPAELSSLLREVPFCSVSCVHAFLMEGIEFLDGFTDPRSRATCSDLREVLAAFHEADQRLPA